MITYLIREFTSVETYLNSMVYFLIIIFSIVWHRIVGGIPRTNLNPFTRRSLKVFSRPNVSDLPQSMFRCSGSRDDSVQRAYIMFDGADSASKRSSVAAANGANASTGNGATELDDAPHWLVEAHYLFTLLYKSLPIHSLYSLILIVYATGNYFLHSFLTLFNKI